MRSIIIQGALLCALTTYAHAGGAVGVGLSVIKDQYGNNIRHITRKVGGAQSQIPPGLQRIMAEGAGRVANMTCADVRAVVAIYGAWKVEAVARAAGATEHQIREAKRCLGSSSR